MSTLEQRRKILDQLVATNGAGFNQSQQPNWGLVMGAINQDVAPRTTEMEQAWQQYADTTSAAKDQALNDYGLALATQNWFAQLEKDLAKNKQGGGGGGGSKGSGKAKDAPMLSSPQPVDYGSIWDMLGVGDYSGPPSYTPSTQRSRPSNESGRGYSTAGVRPPTRRAGASTGYRS